MPDSTTVPPALKNQTPASALPESTETEIFAAPLGAGMMSASANAQPGESVEALLARLLDDIMETGGIPIQANVFCDPALGKQFEHERIRPLMTRTSEHIALPAFPMAFLGRHDTPGGCVLSARITSISSELAHEYVRDERGSICGVKWETPNAQYLMLGALTPPDVSAARGAQAAAAWRLLKKRLDDCGFTPGNLVRTWFFNDHILDWYGDFNRERNAFFTENNIFGALVPASTGVGASNAAGAALSLDAFAVAPKNNRIRVEAVASPLQCAAYDYKSAFSRAVEYTVTTDRARYLLVSGTASIEPGGKTVHQGDLDAQINLSLRVVGAILKSRRLNWDDTVRAILYFPKIEWMRRWETRRIACGLPEIPAIFAHCDICRDDLLFEIEMEAWTEGGR